MDEVKTYTYRAMDEEYTVVAVKNHYANNGRVRLDFATPDGEPIATATVNLPEVELGPGEVCIKTWSENEAMLAFLVHNRIVEDTGHEIQVSQYAFARVCRLLI